MAKAIFHQVFHWRRPKSRFGFHAEPSDQPQSFPADFIEAAVLAGVAKKVPPARKKAATSGKVNSRESGTIKE